MDKNSDDVDFEKTSDSEREKEMRPTTVPPNEYSAKVEDTHSLIHRFEAAHTISRLAPLWLLKDKSIIEQYSGLIYKTLEPKITDSNGYVALMHETIHRLENNTHSSYEQKEIEAPPKNGTVSEKHDIYRLHSNGHQVLISKITRGSQGIVSSYASQSELKKILCSMKQPLIIDSANLSRLQMSSILRTIKEIDEQIVIKKVQHKGRIAIVAKYVG